MFRRCPDSAKCRTIILSWPRFDAILPRLPPAAVGRVLERRIRRSGRRSSLTLYLEARRRGRRGRQRRANGRPRHAPAGAHASARCQVPVRRHLRRRRAQPSISSRNTSRSAGPNVQSLGSRRTRYPSEKTPFRERSGVRPAAGPPSPLSVFWCRFIRVANLSSEARPGCTRNGRCR